MSESVNSFQIASVTFTSDDALSDSATLCLNGKGRARLVPVPPIETLTEPVIDKEYWEGMVQSLLHQVYLIRRYRLGWSKEQLQKKRKA